MFTYQFTKNQQTATGDLDCEVIYTNGNITITEKYPATADATQVIATVNSRLSQLQQAEDFVTNNSVSQPPSSVTIDMPVTPSPISTPPSLKPVI